MAGGVLISCTKTISASSICHLLTQRNAARAQAGDATAVMAKKSFGFLRALIAVVFAGLTTAAVNRSECADIGVESYLNLVLNDMPINVEQSLIQCQKP